MTDDPTVQWELATGYGIQIKEDEEAWHSGHVDDIVELQDHVGIVVATESGGVWWIDDNSYSLQLSDTWDNPDVKCLALGPDDPRHMFAGCTVAYDSAQKRSYKAETGSAPVIMETDSASIAPLLAWNPITAALPVTAGRVTRIVVIRNLRRIVVTCASVRPNDTGGIFWAEIPPTRFNAGDPPRPPYVWRRATVVGIAAGQGFWDIAVAATRDDTSRDNLEDSRTITLVAGGFAEGGLVVGSWDSADDLVFTRPAVSSSMDGSDVTARLFDSCSTSSVSSCENRPTVLYAACAWPDGRLNSLLRSNDGGRNWTFCGAQKAGGAGATDLINPLVGERGHRWNNCISAHPTNPDVAALGWQNGPFLTIDGGTNWRLIDGSPHLHVDLHALRFSIDRPDSIGNLFVGSDGGVARINLDDVLNPPGQSGQPFRSDYNRNLPTLQIYSTLIRQFYGTLDAASERLSVVAGLQDNGNVRVDLRPVDAPWYKVEGGDGGWNALVDNDFAHVRNIMGEAVKASYILTGLPLNTPPQSQFGDQYPRDSVIPVGTSLPPDKVGLKAQIGEAVMQPTHRNPAGQLLVAVAAENQSNKVFGLFHGSLIPPPEQVQAGTEDPVYHWEEIGTLPVGEWVSALGSFHGEKVFAGTEGQGNMYVIDVATKSVIKQTVALPKPSPSTQMKGGTFLRIVGFVDETKLFATLLGATEVDISTGAPVLGTPAVQGYVLRLDGDTWNVTAGAGLPNELLYGFVAVNAPGTRIEHGLLVSTDDAVYISRDEGQNWRRASSGLPRRPHCGDLRSVVHSGPADDPEPGDPAYIYLGTFGRSLWIVTLSGPKPGQQA